MMTLQDKVKGSLFGGAVGDALGYAVEFMSYGQITDKYGVRGITRYDTDSEGVAEISDDTQMTLFTANALLNCHADYATKGIMHWPAHYIKQAYIEWYHTQFLDCGDIVNPACWLSNVPEMFASRAPGNTCIGALKRHKLGKPVQNDSKGCGGIMRVAPIALYGAVHNKDIATMVQVACDSAYLTHHHPLGWLSAGLMVYVLQTLMNVEEVNETVIMDTVHDGIRLLATLKDAPEDAVKELKRGSDQAIMMAHSDETDVEAIRQLGGGWTGEEAWYIALYCTLKHLDNFEEAIVAAVNHSGDSDSTGAVCGNLMGAIHGYTAIPQHFRQNLELSDVILTMADDLYSGKISK